MVTFLEDRNRWGLTGWVTQATLAEYDRSRGANGARRRLSAHYLICREAHLPTMRMPSYVNDR